MLGNNPKKNRSPQLRFLMAMGGIISVGLGIVGIVLPILPTTPFFLLSAFLFVRSSNRLYHWLLHHKVFGSYIRNYIQNKSITKGVKIFSLSLLWLTISISIYITRHTLWLQALLFIIATAVTIHILSLNTYKKRKIESNNMAKNMNKNSQ